MKFEHIKPVIVYLSIFALTMATLGPAHAQRGGRGNGGGSGGGGGSHQSTRDGGGGGSHHSNIGGGNNNQGRGDAYNNQGRGRGHQWTGGNNGGRGENHARSGQWYGGFYHGSPGGYSGYPGHGNYRSDYRYGVGAGYGRYGYSSFPWYGGIGLYGAGIGLGLGFGGYGNGGGYYSGGSYSDQTAPIQSTPTAAQIPADQDYVPQLNKTSAELAAGASGKAVLGVTFDTAYPEAAVVGSVTPGGAAERAGLSPGDMVTSIDQKQVQGYSEVVNFIGGMQPGVQLTIEFVRPILRSEVRAAAPEVQFQQSQPAATSTTPPGPATPPLEPTPQVIQ